MKNIIICFLCSFCSIFSVVTNAQNLDDILLHHTKAMGGLEAWKNFNTHIIIHDSKQGDKAYVSTLTMKMPNKFRIDLDAGATQRIKAYDGKEGWIIQNGSLKEMPKGEDLEMAEETEFYGELVMGKERGHQLKYLGLDTLGGKEVYKVKMTKSETDEQFYYLNKETYLLEMVAEYSEDVSWKGVLFKTTFDDYRMIDGLLFPFKMKLFADDRLLRNFETRSIEVNVPVDDAVFEKDQAIIRRNIRLFSEALVRQDYDFVVEAYTADGKIFPSGRLILEGHQAIRDYWTPKEGSTSRITSHKVRPEEIKLLGDEAYDYGYYEGSSIGNDGKEYHWKGKYVITWKEVAPDIWKIYLDIWNPVK